MKSSVTQAEITMLYNAVLEESEKECVHVLHAVPMVDLLSALTYADSVCKAILAKHGKPYDSRRTEYMQTPANMLKSFQQELSVIGLAA